MFPTFQDGGLTMSCGANLVAPQLPVARVAIFPYEMALISPPQRNRHLRLFGSREPDSAGTNTDCLIRCLLRIVSTGNDGAGDPD